LTPLSLKRRWGGGGWWRWRSDGWGLRRDWRRSNSDRCAGRSATARNHGGRSRTILNGVATRELWEELAFDDFVDDGLLLARVHLRVVLNGEFTAAFGLTTNVSAFVHGPLERIVLPAEEVVTVLSKASGVAHAEHEGLASVSRPLVGVLVGIPDDLVEDEREADGVGGRASADVEEVTIPSNVTGGPCNVAGVIGDIDVLSVPAGWEEDVGSDTTSTVLLGEVDGVQGTSSGVGVRVVAGHARTEASECQSPGLSRVGVGIAELANHGVSDDHTEALGWSGHLDAAGPAVDNWLNVVGGDSSFGAASVEVGLLWDSEVRAVPGFEVQDGGPVVREVLLEPTGGTGRRSGDVHSNGHAQVEGITTDNLMDVRRNLTWSDQRVRSLSHELSAWETKEGRREGRERRKDEK